MKQSLSASIVGLFIGKAEHHWAGKPPSAIAKKYTTGPLELGTNGFLDDEQTDLRVHGGIEKAIHHYASEHMSFWQELFPDQADSFTPGCFGENISTLGLNETNICLGDEFLMGSAMVQVCQGRQPCWKLNAHLGLDTLAMQFQKTGRTGWYYRVLKSGSVSVGDNMVLQHRRHPDWPLSRVIAARFQKTLNASVAEELANLSALSERWRSAFAKKMSTTFVENTHERLNAPGDNT